MLAMNGSLYDVQTLNLPVVHWTAAQLEKQRSCGAHKTLGVILTLRYFLENTALQRTSASGSQCCSSNSAYGNNCQMQPDPQ